MSLKTERKKKKPFYPQKKTISKKINIKPN